MKPILLDTEYSINLATCYFIDNPKIRMDWLIIILHFDQIFSVVGSGKNQYFKGLVEIEQYPFDKILRTKSYTGRSISDPDETHFRLIELCLTEDYLYLPNPFSSDRENLISLMGAKIPESIPFLKESFLRFEILKSIITAYLPSIDGEMSIELRDSLIEFKTSEFQASLNLGIETLLQKYSGNYIVTDQIKNEIQDYTIEHQKRFLELIEFDKIKSLDLKPLVEDGIGTLGGLLTPFLPLGTIKELYFYFKNKATLKNDKDILFVFSLMYLQKLLTSHFVNKAKNPQCPFCKLTAVEINNIPSDEVDDFIFSSTDTMCMDHLIFYLNIRSFHQLTGRDLLMALKEINK